MSWPRRCTKRPATTPSTGSRTRLLTIQQEPDGVAVTFEQSSAARFDLVIELMVLTPSSETDPPDRRSTFGRWSADRRLR